MKPFLKATFVALSLGTAVAGSAMADNAGTPGCASAARQTEAEGGGVGSVNAVTRKTEAEGGGVGSVGQATSMAAASPCR